MSFWSRWFERPARVLPGPGSRLNLPPETVDLSARAQRPQALLRPVQPLFIWLSLFAGLMLDLMPWSMGPVPDFAALVLIYWNVHQSRRVGIAVAFVFGLMLDVHHGALLGQNALAFTVLSYGAITLHRRIRWFPVGGQIPYVFGLLLAAQAVSLVVRLMAGARYPGMSLFLDSLVGALLWPVAVWLLQMPQRRPLKRDETRPL